MKKILILALVLSSVLFSSSRSFAYGLFQGCVAEEEALNTALTLNDQVFGAFTGMWWPPGSPVPVPAVGSIFSPFPAGTPSMPIANLISAFDCAAQSITAAISSRSLSKSALVQERNRAKWQTMAQKFSQKAALKANSSLGTAFIPPGTCAHDVATASAGQAVTNAGAMVGVLDQNTDSYDHFRPLSGQAVKAISAQPSGAFSASTLFGTSDLSGGSVVMDTTNAANFINNVTRILPPAPLTQKEMATHAGQEKWLNQNSDNAVLSLSHHVLSQVFAMRSPSINVSGLGPELAGISGVQAPLGEMSLMQVFELESEAYFSHTAYRSIMSEQLDRVTRIRTQILALRAEIRYHRNRLKQELSSMYAVYMARKIQ